MWRALDRLRAEGPDGPARRALAGDSAPAISSAKLKLVDACNLRCMMCDYWRGRRDGELTTAEVVRILGELRELGCEKVHFTGGEIFLRRDAVDLFERARDLGMRVNLTTNGTRLDRDRIRRLLRVPVRSITLSIDAPVPAIHDQIRGRAGAFRATVKTLDRLLDRRRSKTRIRINTVVNRHNYRALVEMPALLRDRPVDGWLLIPMDPWVDTDAAMTADDVRDYNAHVAPILAETVRIDGFDPFVYGRGEIDVDHAARQQWARGFYREHRCFVPWFHLLIDARGDVYPCCMGHQRLPVLGNVRRASLAAIWHGDDYRRFRHQMAAEQPAICHRCDDFVAENRAIDAWLRRPQ